ncbi:MAG: hypothetical protein ABEJ26_06405 [Halosimplex sp.]
MSRCEIEGCHREATSLIESGFWQDGERHTERLFICDTCINAMQYRNSIEGWGYREFPASEQ